MSQNRKIGDELLPEQERERDEILRKSKHAGNSEEPQDHVEDGRTVYYPFCDFERAFSDLEERHEKGENVRLVINSAHYTSGYYVEPCSCKLTEYDIPYTAKEARELHKRVVKEINEAKKDCRNTILVL